ncbi:MAG: ATP-dependent helicase [Parasporobacterium sp.]|nr:ATP-dependent helicase [Parasporobacterium sp.]
MAFNKFQIEAISHFKGPMLVLAGPGSGKTTVITARLFNLIHNHNIPPEDILVVTFSRKAASEMRTRFLKDREAHGSTDDNCPLFGTFHSVFYRIIRESCPDKKFNIVHDSTRINLIRTELERFNIDYDDRLISAVLGDISLTKEASGKIPSVLRCSISRSRFIEIYENYNSALSKSRLIDFDDILIMCMDLLQSDAALRKTVQKNFKYILIDEFQDINLLQYDIIRILGEPENNIFAVGDDDQSIYAFRGADSGLIARFLKDFPEAARTALRVNYRCRPQIIEAAGLVIDANASHLPKHPEAFKDKGSHSIFLKEYKDRRTEAKELGKLMIELHEKGTAYRDMAVLLRKGNDMFIYSETLVLMGIPASAGGEADFNEHFIFRDISAYLRLALSIVSGHGFSPGDFIRVINKPVRFISRNALRDLNDKSDIYYTRKMLLKAYRNNRSETAVIEKLFRDLSAISELPAFSAVKYIRKVMGYDKYLEQLAEEKEGDIEEYMLILDILEAQSRQCSSIYEFISGRDNLPKKTEDREVPADGVNIMTMHASKGLEFDIVFLPELNSTVIPHAKAETKEDMEEERRLLYVAMTRAREKLYMSYVSRMHNVNGRISPFIQPLKDSKLKKGMI